MNSNKALLIVALLITGYISTSESIPFAETISRYKNNEISRKQLIREYDSLKEADKTAADEATYQILHLSIKQLKNAEEFQDNFGKLVDLYTHQELTRQQLIEIYDDLEEDDDKLLAEQAINIRLKKSISQLKKDELTKAPEYSVERAAVQKKPAARPEVRSRPQAQLPQISKQSAPLAWPTRTSSKGGVQLRIERGLAQTQQDINAPFARRPRPAVKKFIKKATSLSEPLTESEQPPAYEGLDPRVVVEEKERLEIQKRQEERRAQRLKEEVAPSYRLRSQRLSAAEPEELNERKAQAEEMKRRATAIKQNIEEPGRQSSPIIDEPAQAQRQARLAELSEQVLEKKELEGQPVAAPAASQDRRTKSKKRPVRASQQPLASALEPQVQEEQPHIAPSPMPSDRLQQAQEMRRRMARIKEQKTLRIYRGMPVLPQNNTYYLPNQPEFVKNLNSVPLLEALSLGQQLAQLHQTDEARWKVINELVTVYKQPHSPTGQLRGLMQAMINEIENKEVADYQNLPNELKAE